MFELLVGIICSHLGLIVLIIQAFFHIAPFLLLCILISVFIHFSSARCCKYSSIKTFVQKLE